MPGKVGQAFHCDGDDHINVPDPGPPGSGNLDIVSAGTFTAWVRPTQRGAAVILQKWEAYGMELLENGNLAWRFSNRVPDWPTTIDTGYRVPINEWTFFAVTHDNGVVRTYDASGTLRHVFRGSGSLTPLDSDVRICAGGPGPPANFWRGGIDELRIFNTVLDEAAIRQVASLGSSRSAAAPSKPSGDRASISRAAGSAMTNLEVPMQQAGQTLRSPASSAGPVRGRPVDVGGAPANLTRKLFTQDPGRSAADESLGPIRARSYSMPATASPPWQVDA